MYLEFYGLKDFPFRLAPDPKYLFKSEGLMEVLANLQYGIEDAKGLLVITGEVGTGKTTALRSHLASQGTDMLSAYIFNPLLSTEEFYDTLAGEFRLRTQATKSAMLRSIGSLLLSRHFKGLRTVLIIDEAHLLPLHLLEEIRLLSNFETSREKLVQIILCGQPELGAVLEVPEMRQLKQRVSLRCQVNTMNLIETADYINCRLQVAGAIDDGPFTTEAVLAIHRISGGIPRMVNNICDNALLTGYSQDARCITPEIVTEVAEVLGFQDPLQRRNEVASSTAELQVDPVECSGDPDAFTAQGREWSMSGRGERRRPNNVRYIHRDFTELETSQVQLDKVRFTIEITSEAVADDSPSSRFFSRVRVNKCS